MKEREIKIIARGLRPPGPVLMLKKKLGEIELKGNLRVIVSSRDSAEDLIDYLKEIGADHELDRAGDDYHVLVDLGSINDKGVQA